MPRACRLSDVCMSLDPILVVNYTSPEIMENKKVSKGTAKALTRNLFLTQMAILLHRLALLETEIQTLIHLRENLYCRVYLQWWDKFYRRKILVRLLELNRFLWINVTSSPACNVSSLFSFYLALMEFPSK